MIKLTEKSDYAIRTLVYLAENKDRRVTNARLAKALQASPHHLYKVVQALAKGGYLATTAGRSGGIRLVKPAGEITLLEIIRLIEGPIHLSKCIISLDQCSFASHCRLRRKIKEAQEALAGVFRETTIEDLAREKENPAPVYSG